MAHAFAEIAFTASVKAAQQRDGSRSAYARSIEADSEPINDRLGPDEIDFVLGRRSFRMATASATGWPYQQRRGDLGGFLNVLDDRTLAIADYTGTRQFISVGDVADNDRIALILVDYATRPRPKPLGRMTVEDLQDQPELEAALLDRAYPARAQRAMVISVAGFDWTCPQHIPALIDDDLVRRSLNERDRRIADLTAQLQAVTAASASPAPPA